jgi:hypothetical protein
MCLNVLIGDAVERAVVVETEVTSVNDVVGASVRSELVQRLQVSYNESVSVCTLES